MPARAKMISCKTLHEGYCKIRDVTLEVPSLAEGSPAREMRRELMICTDAVMVLVYIPTADSFLLAQEFRAGVACNVNGAEDPLIWQCIAGAIDKDLSPEDIARAELEEEAGIDASALPLTPVTIAYSSPGRTTEKVYLYLAELAAPPQTGLYGLIDHGEEIRTALFTRAQVYDMLDQGKIIDSASQLALNWFRARRG